MSLQDIIKKSKAEKKANSPWISTMIGDEGEVVCDKYIGAEEGVGQYGKQVVVTLIVNGEEKKLGRPIPFSNSTLRFFEELNKAKDSPPFTICKKIDERGFPEYNIK